MATLEIMVDPGGSNTSLHILSLLVTVEQEVAIHGLFQLNKWNIIRQDLPDKCDMCGSIIKRNMVMEENQLHNLFTESESSDADKMEETTQCCVIIPNLDATEKLSSELNGKSSELAALLQSLPGNPENLIIQQSENDNTILFFDQDDANLELGTGSRSSKVDKVLTDQAAINLQCENSMETSELAKDTTETETKDNLNFLDESSDPGNYNSETMDLNKGIGQIADPVKVNQTAELVKKDPTATDLTKGGQTADLDKVSQIADLVRVGQTAEIVEIGQIAELVKVSQTAELTDDKKTRTLDTHKDSCKILVQDPNQSISENGDPSNVTDEIQLMPSEIWKKLKNDQENDNNNEVNNSKENECDVVDTDDQVNFEKHGSEVGNNLIKNEYCSDSLGKVSSNLNANEMEVEDEIPRLHKPETQIGEEFFPYQCDKCDRGFVKEKQLQRHRKIHIGSSHVCHVCGKLFKRQHYLSIHLRVHDFNQEKKFKCEICEKTFAYACSLQRHQYIHSGIRKYVCDICGKRFCQSSHLDDHLNTHRNKPKPKPYKCEYCDQWFAYASSRARHRMTHTGSKPFSCSICGKKFTQSHRMKSHEKLHSGERPHKCELCTSSFATASALNVHHRQVHLSEADSHCCLFCSKTFSTKNALKKHVNIHTEEIFHKCNSCGRTFTQLVSLQRHQKTHLAPKLYKCFICGLTFTNKVERKEHSRWHDRERDKMKEHRCTICDKVYAARSSYIKHFKKEHGTFIEAKASKN